MPWLVLSTHESTEMDVYKMLARPHRPAGLVYICRCTVHHVPLACPLYNVDNDGMKCHAGSLPTRFSMNNYFSS